MVVEAQAMVRRWPSAATGETEVDVRAEMVELTARIIGRVLFGADIPPRCPT